MLNAIGGSFVQFVFDSNTLFGAVVIVCTKTVNLLALNFGRSSCARAARDMDVTVIPSQYWPPPIP